MASNPFRGCAPLLLLAALLPAGAALALVSGEGWPAPYLLALLLVPVPLLLRRPLGAAALLALSAGIHGGASSLPPPPERVAPFLSGESVLDGTAREGRPGEDGWSAVLEAALVSPPGGGPAIRLGRVRLHVSGGGEPDRYPARVRAMGRLRPVDPGGNPFGLPGERDALAERYRYRFHAAGGAVVLAAAPAGSGIRARLGALRARTRAWILAAAGAGEGTLYLLSLATGDEPPPGHPLRELLRRTGLAHLLAISGINVAVFHVMAATVVRLLLWSLLGFGGGRAGAPDLRPLSSLLALCASWGYVLLAGAPVPALRSAAMLTLAVASRHAFGRGGAGACLSLAAVGALAANPFLVLSPSFLLSYGAAFFLVAAFAGGGWSGRSGEGWRSRLPRWGKGLVQGAAVASCGTLPVATAFFGSVPLLSIPWNVAFAPILGTAGVAGAAAAVAAGCGGVGLLAGPVRWWAAGLGKAIALLRVVSADGALCIEVPPPGGASTAFFTLAGAVGALLLRRAGRSAWPAPVASSLLFLAWIHLPYLALPPDRLEAVFLDAGKGGSAVLFLPGGKTVVADGGSALHGDAGRRILVPFLRSRGVRRVDLLVLTHPHEDHYGGAAALADTLPVAERWIAAGTEPGEYGAAGAGARPVGRGERYPFPGGWLRVAASGGEGRGANARCLQLEARCGPLSIWLPGDSEGGPGEGWEGRGPGGDGGGPGREVRLLVLPHHGSRGADPAGWGRLCRPEASLTQLADCFTAENLVFFGRIYSLDDGAFRAATAGRLVTLGYLSPWVALRRILLGVPGGSA